MLIKNCVICDFARSNACAHRVDAQDNYWPACVRRNRSSDSDRADNRLAAACVRLAISPILNIVPIILSGAKIEKYLVPIAIGIRN